MTPEEKAAEAEKNLQEIFKEDPELKKAFKETIAEMKKPENIKRDAAAAAKAFNKIMEVARNGKGN